MDGKNVKFIKMKGIGPISWTISSPPTIHEYAAELRRRIDSKEQTGTASDYLAEPLLDCQTGHATGFPLVNWMHFNPLGPTVAILWYIPVPGTEEGLLKVHVDNPFDRQRIAFGLVPDDHDLKHVKEAVVALFAANGHPSLPLFRSLPTSVAHRENWEAETQPPEFNHGLSRELFRYAARSVWPSNIQSICSRIWRYRDPWERTLIEYHETLRSGRGGANDRPANFDEEQFNEWFDLVSDRSHVETERRNFRAAWEGAIQVRKVRQSKAN